VAAPGTAADEGFPAAAMKSAFVIVRFLSGTRFLYAKARPIVSVDPV
jgi:hypothetical protein